MGLLDDAIREHLDLKRRRGADPADVERAEREALGPVRRAPTSQGVEVADQQDDEAGFAYDHEEELGWSGDPRDAPPAGTGARDRDLESDFDDDSFLEPEVRPEPEQRPSRLARIFGRADPAPEPEAELVEPELEDAEFDQPLDRTPPARARRRTERLDPLDPLEEPDPLGEPDSSRPIPSPRPAGGLGDETTEYQVESGLDEPEAPADGEDVLEETPEFLQDTPDHDRLWFEQRPPKDFDFDG